MPIDSSIALGFKQPDTMQSLSSLMNVANSAQTLQQNTQKTENEGITLQERKGLQGFFANKENFTDETGALDLNKMQSGISKVAPTTGFKYMQEAAAAHKAHTEATAALNSLSTDNRARIGGVLAALPDGATADLVNQTVDAIGKQYKGIAPLVDVFKQGYERALKTGGPKAADEFRLQAARGVLPQETQQTMNTPTGVTISNGQQTAVVNTRPGVQGIGQGEIVPGTQVQQLLPVGQQEGVTNDGQGNMHVVQRDKFGNVVGTRPLQGAPAPGGAPQPGPFTLPAGETKESMAELQAQRTAAQTAANTAPVMHDINQTIVREASKGLNTGTLGQLTQKLSSATGYTVGKDEATDYNLLGKMLERSALTAAQSMGPHTNAGLEASIRANGSLEYTPTAIKKIAHLNDALVSGAELYRDGLEKTISGSANNIFAKREFDQKWSKVATPQVLRLKNAVDNGNPEEISSILKEVGGKGSDGAKKLHKQLTELLQLAGR